MANFKESAQGNQNLLVFCTAIVSVEINKYRSFTETEYLRGDIYARKTVMK